MESKDMSPWDRALSLYRREGGDPFQSLQREINRLFDDTFGCRNALGSAPSGKWPRLELSETDAAYTVTAELPGMEEKDVEVALSGDVLTIKGERRSETKDETKHLEEIYYGSFERRLPVPDGVDRDKVAGSFKNGVLTLTLPKQPAAAAAAKRIPLKPG